MIFANDRLIVALDVPTKHEAKLVFDELRETGCAFKIGLQLFTAAGSDFVRELVNQNARIFLDLKFHDIPNTIANAAIEVARLGVWMFNVHAAGGGEMMERTAGAVRETAAREQFAVPKIIAVTVLTSSNHATLRQIGVERELLAQVLKLAALARESGLDGVVASAHEAAEIKMENGQLTIDNEKQKDFIVVTPGVRPLSITSSLLSIAADDQKRVLTPAAAIANGADYLVVGRPILTAPDKVGVVNQILSEMRQANSAASE